MNPEKIDINTASVGQLTQLPGIAVNVARNIVNYRQRHGIFTTFGELAAVKQFPVERLAEIRERATLVLAEGMAPPRHLNTSHHEKVAGRSGGYTKALRATRGKDRSHETIGHRPNKAA